MEQQQEEVIARYKSILACSEQMLDFAHDGAWDDLIEKEKVYLREIEQLAHLEPHVCLGAEYREIKYNLLDRIGDVEQQLCAILQERLSRLGEHMAQSRNQSRVRQVYGSGTAT